MYKRSENLNDGVDLKNQQNISKLNRWGVELGRGGFDWFWLKLSKYKKVDKGNIRDTVEKKRFSDSLPATNKNILRKYFKYLTINQYTLKLIRSKYFGMQLSNSSIDVGSGNSAKSLKNSVLRSFYPIGQLGSDKKIKINNSIFNSWVKEKILDRVKQPIRYYLNEKTPYMRYSYVILHQRLLSTYLNYKKKYNRVRYLIKPLQAYFRDFFRYGLDLKKINYISRNRISMINSEIFSKFYEKKK